MTISARRPALREKTLLFGGKKSGLSWKTVNRHCMQWGFFLFGQTQSQKHLYGRTGGKNHESNETRMLAVMAALSLGAGLMAGCGGGGDASSSGSAVTSSGTEAADSSGTSSESASVSASSGEDSAADSAASSGSSGETAEASYPRELQVSEDTTVILESRPERVRP